MNELDSLPLRDIHLPAPVSWWPPAPGWWLLLLLLIFTSMVLWWWRKRQRANALKKSALALLYTSQKRFYLHGDSYLLLDELSTLMRRLSVSVFPRQDVASLTGRAWLCFLDECLAKKNGAQQSPFSTGIGRVFSNTLYQQRERCELTDADAVCQLVEQWITGLPAQDGRSIIRRSQR